MQTPPLERREKRVVVAERAPEPADGQDLGVRVADDADRRSGARAPDALASGRDAEDLERIVASVVGDDAGDHGPVAAVLDAERAVRSEHGAGDAVAERLRHAAGPATARLVAAS